jgi:hypothetical protein
LQRLIFCVLVAWALPCNSFAQPVPPTAGLNLAGEAVNIFEHETAPAIVLVFLRTDCPISNRYAPELQRLRKRFTAKQARFWFIYPSDDAAAVEQHRKAYGFASSDVLRDPQHTLVKMMGVTVTPEAVVYVHHQNENIQTYRGRIDDRVIAFGKQRLKVTQHDLEKTIESVLRREPLSFKEQPAVGCYLVKPDEK